MFCKNTGHMYCNIFYSIIFKIKKEKHSGNSMSNHSGHDSTSQILFIFSLFVDSVEIINPWKFQPSIPYSSKVMEICKFVWNGYSGVKSTIWIYVFCDNYCFSHHFILKFGMGKIFVVGNPKIALRRLENKPVIRYLRFQILSTCDQSGAGKYIWPDR